MNFKRGILTNVAAAVISCTAAAIVCMSLQSLCWHWFLLYSDERTGGTSSAHASVGYRWFAALLSDSSSPLFRSLSDVPVQVRALRQSCLQIGPLALPAVWHVEAAKAILLIVVAALFGMLLGIVQVGRRAESLPASAPTVFRIGFLAAALGGCGGLVAWYISLPRDLWGVGEWTVLRVGWAGLAVFVGTAYASVLFAQSGRRVSEPVCRVCAHPLPSGANRCVECGSGVEVGSLVAFRSWCRRWWRLGVAVALTGAALCGVMLLPEFRERGPFSSKVLGQVRHALLLPRSDVRYAGEVWIRQGAIVRVAGSDGLAMFAFESNGPELRWAAMHRSSDADIWTKATGRVPTHVNTAFVDARAGKHGISGTWTSASVWQAGVTGNANLIEQLDLDNPAYAPARELITLIRDAHR